MLTGIARGGNAETKIKVKCFEQRIAKPVTLNHSKIVYRLCAHFEFNPTEDRKEALALQNWPFKHLKETYVAPTVLSLRKLEVNW